MAEPQRIHLPTPNGRSHLDLAGRGDPACACCWRAAADARARPLAVASPRAWYGRDRPVLRDTLQV